MRCLDCGNKAKKDCMYYRCRTCCKGRGFRCLTHIKSTWVPVSTRRVLPAGAVVADSSTSLDLLHHHHRHHDGREEQQELRLPTTIATANPIHIDQHQRSNPSSRSLREHYNRPPFPSGFQEGILPPEVITAATFVCLRVISASGGDQYAYQTSVNIGGHVFNGILYDQGTDDSTVMNTYDMNLVGGDQQSSSANIRSDLPIDLFNVNNATASPSSNNPPSYSFLF